MADTPTFLVAQDIYLKAGIHIGTKFKTKYMEQFIYKTRPDGLSVLNLQKIDERIGIAAKFLSKYNPEDILVVSRRENGWKALEMFTKVTGIMVFPGRYPPGILTNPGLENFIEKKILLVTDVWPDRNAVNDAVRMGMPVIALCDTNNQSNNIDLVVPCNNKGKKSLGLFFYILAREYLKIKGKLGENEEIKEIPIDLWIEE
jgi:small subunit ribosomal protein S2